MNATQSQVRAALDAVQAIADSIRELGQIPSGHLYAQVMGHMSFEAYERLLAILVNSGVVRRDGDLLTWALTTIGDPPMTVGEQRYSSAGNIYRLEQLGRQHVYVRRIGIVGQNDRELWDKDTVYRWHHSQWDSLPLVGERSTDPSFGIFCPG